MKKFLLAASIAAISAVTAHAALAGDGHTRIRADEDTQIFLGDSGDVLEIRGQLSDRTIDIERDGNNRFIRSNGAEIVIRGERVFVNGEELDSSGHNVIILDGDNVHIEQGDNADHVIYREERAEHEARRRVHRADRMIARAERQAHRHHESSDHVTFQSWDDLSEEEREQVREDLANAHADVRRAMVDVANVERELVREFHDGSHVYEFEFGDIEAHVVESLEMALSGLNERDIMDSDDWADLSEEEQAEVLEELAEAREEIRMAMSEVRIEMENARGEMEEGHHRMRIEMRDVARDSARAERDLARAARDLARAERHRDREERRRVRHEWREGEVEHFSSNVRVERDDDGEVHVWINGEEQEAGEHVYVTGMHIEERHHNRNTENDRNIRIEEQTDGRRRIWVDGEEQTGDDLVRWLNQLENERLEGANPTR
jgi:hypothetical protein